MLNAADEGKVVFPGLLVLSAAFGTVDHYILLRHLEVTFGNWRCQIGSEINLSSQIGFKWQKQISLLNSFQFGKVYYYYRVYSWVFSYSFYTLQMLSRLLPSMQ